MSEPTLNPEHFQAPPQIDTLQRVAFGVGLLGLVGLLAGFATDSAQFYKSYLLGSVFVLGVPIGSLALLMVHHLSGGRWSLVLRRTFEASARTIPMMAVLFLPVILGIHDLYHWSHADAVAHDAILQHKAPYLNTSGFVIRAVGIGYFYDVITNGFGQMPDYAAQVAPADRWAIAAYIRALQLSQSGTIDDVPADQRGTLDGSAAGAPQASHEGGAAHE